MLLSVMLLITIMLIVLAASAPRIAQQIKRSKEEELVNRGMQYAIAIKKFFHKTGNYPTSLEQLEDTNHLRFLRKKYADPMTGEANWKLVHLGEAEIPIAQNRAATLQGSSSLGSLSTTPGGQQNTLGNNPTQPQNPPGAPTGFSPPSGQQPTLQSGNQLGALSTQNISNGLGGAGQQFGGGAIIGVASVSKGTGIKEFNGKSDYDEWLFVYDPRLEQAAAAAGIGGSATAGIVVAAPRGEGGTGTTGGAGGAGGAGGTGGNTGNGGGQTPSGTPTPAPALPR